MIEIFCPTKNRASQLYTLIKSSEYYSLGEPLVWYIYETSDGQFFKKGYDKLRSKNLRNVHFFESKGVVEDISDCLSRLQTNYMMMITDDTYFFDFFYLTENLLKRTITEKVLCFNLRYGSNILLEYIPNNTFTNPIRHYVSIDEPNMIKWDWTIQNDYHAAGFGWAMDGHIFHKEDIYETIKGKFPKYRDREQAIVNDSQWKKRPYMVSFKKSVAVNIPINHVQGGMDSGDYFPISVENLNKKLINGTVFDYTIYVDVLCHHQEFPLKYYREEFVDNLPDIEGHSIRCHPNMIQYIKGYFFKNEDHIHRPFGPNFICDESMSPYKYEIVDKRFEADRFCLWFEDLNRPPEWAINLGVVRACRWLAGIKNADEIMKGFL